MEETQSHEAFIREAIQEIRQEHRIIVGEDDPLMAYVTLSRKLNADLEGRLERITEAMKEEMLRLSKVTEASINESLAQISESTAKASLEQILAEVTSKARQDSDLTHKLEARLKLSERTARNLFKKFFLSLSLLTATNLIAAGVTLFL